MLNAKIMLLPSQFQHGDFVECLLCPHYTTRVHAIHFTKKKVRYDLDVEWYDQDAIKDKSAEKFTTRIYNVDSVFVVQNRPNHSKLPEEITKRFDDLQQIVLANQQSGTFNKNPYQFGLANGLIYALRVVLNQEIEYLKEPDTWLDNSQKTKEIPLEESDPELFAQLPKKQVKDIRYRLEMLPQEARMKAFEYAKARGLKDELSFPASNTTDALDVVLPDFDKDTKYHKSQNDYWHNIKTEADKEWNILFDINEMCCQSLDPKTYAKWEEVKEMLECNRKML